MLFTLLLLAAGGLGLAWTWRTRPDQRPLVLVVVAAGGLGFQLVHVAEHVIQAGVWVTNPGQPAFLTPWAAAGRDALAVGGDVALGAELLHLVGNAIFMAGLAALSVLAGSRRGRALPVAVWVQAAHVAEHVLLTASVGLFGSAIGVTTLFGALTDGPVAVGVRVVAHFVLNGVASVAAGAALVGHLHVRRHAPSAKASAT